MNLERSAPRLRPIYSLLVAGLLVGAIALRLYTYTFDSNITGFFQIGSVLPLSPYLPAATTKTFPNAGYDGQFFLTIALDPLLQSEGSVAALDAPGYRYRRILYPFLGYLLGAGNPQWIPYALVGINLLCILLLLGVLSYSNPWSGLAVLAIPGFWTVLGLSTADLLSTLLAVVALVSYRDRQPGRTAIALSLACLTRETMLVQWGAIALACIGENRIRDLKFLVWALPLPIAWNLYVALRAANWNQGNNFQDNFGLPLVGITQKLLQLLQRGWTIGNGVEALAFLGLLTVLVTTLTLAWRYRRDNLVLLTSAGCYGGLLAVSSLAILAFAEGYNRIYLPVYGLLFLLRLPPSLQGYSYAALGLSGLVTGKLLLDLLV